MLRLPSLAAWILCGALALAPQIAPAEVAGKTFTLSISSTVAGVVGGYVTFNTDGTYNYSATNGSWGYGTYLETVDSVTGTSVVQGSGIGSDGYQGAFVAQSAPISLGGTLPVTTLVGLGVGNLGDVFFAVGFSVDAGGSDTAEGSRGTDIDGGSRPNRVDPPPRRDFRSR
jgi:hypothetical protein